jgi:hypothetical protein
VLVRWAGMLLGLGDLDLEAESVRERPEGDGEFDGGKLEDCSRY